MKGHIGDEEWREQLTVAHSGTATYPLIVRAYGGGAKPIINGSDLVETWTQDDGGSVLHESYFEGGDLSEWDNYAPSGSSTIVASGTAAYNGSYGALVTISDDDDAYIREVTYANQSEIYLQFYINFDSWQGVDEGVITLVQLTTDDDTYMFNMALEYEATGDYHFLYIRDKEDGGSYNESTTWTCDADLLDGEWHKIEIHWKAATGDGNNDGIAEYWVDDISRASEGDHDTDTRAVGRHYIGAMSVDSGCSGVFYLDDIVLHTEAYGAANQWQAALTTEPNQVFFDGVRGNKQTALVDVDSANDWFWATNVLYVYYEEDPDGAVDIEASVYTQCIVMDTKDYITIQDLHLKNANVSGINLKEPCTYCQILDNTIEYCATYGVKLEDANNDHNTIDGNTISNTRLINGCVGIQLFSSSNNTISNNTSSYCYDSIKLSAGSADNIIKNNTVHHSVDDGMDIIGAGTDDNIIRYNLAYSNGNSGIKVHDNADSNEIYYNISYENTPYQYQDDAGGNSWYNNVGYKGVAASATGLLIGSSATNVTAKNNIFLDCTKCIYKTTGSTLTSIDYNSYYPDGGDYFHFDGSSYDFEDWQTNSSQDANSLITDPHMIDPANGDFTLQFGSPCIDAGVDVGLTEDYVGNPVGGKARAVIKQIVKQIVKQIIKQIMITFMGYPDIGAYEYCN